MASPAFKKKTAGQKASKRASNAFETITSMDSNGYITVAGEVFLLYPPGQAGPFLGIDTGEVYSDILKGEQAFKLLFFGEGSGELGAPPAEPQVFTNNEKTRLKNIFIRVFGVNTDKKVRVPCLTADLELLTIALKIRKLHLEAEIKDYDKVSREDIHSRALRIQYGKLNKIINTDLKNSVDCIDVDSKKKRMKELDEARMKHLLEVFAYLLAQGKDPMAALEGADPEPEDILPTLATSGAPTLGIYESELSRSLAERGMTVEDWIDAHYPGTLKKIKGILEGKELDSGTKGADLDDEFMDRVEAIERYLEIPMRGGGPGKEELMDRFNTIRRRIEEKEGEVAARVAAAQAERNVARAGEAAAARDAAAAVGAAAAAETARAAAEAALAPTEAARVAAVAERNARPDAAAAAALAAERDAAVGRAAAAEAARDAAEAERNARPDAAAAAALAAARAAAEAALVAEKAAAEGRASAAEAALATESDAKAAAVGRAAAAEAARDAAEAQRNARPDAAAAAAALATERDAKTTAEGRAAAAAVALAAERDAKAAAESRAGAAERDAAAAQAAVAAEKARGEAAAAQAAQAAQAAEKARAEAEGVVAGARSEAEKARGEAQGALIATAVAETARAAAETDRNTKVAEAQREVAEARAAAAAARAEAAAAAAAVMAARGQAAEARGQAEQARQGLAAAAGPADAQRAALAVAEAATTNANQRANAAEAAARTANEKAAAAEARAAGAETRAAGAEAAVIRANEQREAKAAENAEVLKGVRAQAQAAAEAANSKKAENAAKIAQDTVTIAELTQRADAAEADLRKKNVALEQSTGALRKATEEHVAALAAAEQRHATAVADAQRIHDAELREARTGKEGEAKEVERAHAAALSQLNEAHATELAQLTAGQATELARLRAEQEKALATANEANRQALEQAAAATREAQSQLAALQETNGRLQAESKANTELHRKLLISIKAELERQRKDAEDGVEPEAISKDIQDIIDLIKKHKGVVDSLKTELEQNKVALEQATKGCDELREKYNGLIGKLTIADVLLPFLPPLFSPRPAGARVENNYINLLPGMDEGPYGLMINRILSTEKPLFNLLNKNYRPIGDHDTFFDLTLEQISQIEPNTEQFKEQSLKIKTNLNLIEYILYLKNQKPTFVFNYITAGLVVGVSGATRGVVATGLGGVSLVKAASLPLPVSVPSPPGSPSAAAALAATGPLAVARASASPATIDFTKIKTKEQLITLSIQQIFTNIIRPYLNLEAKLIYDKIKEIYPLNTGERSDLTREGVIFGTTNILNTPIKTLLNSSINTPPFTKPLPAQKQKSLAFVESIKTAVLGPRIAAGARNHGPGKEWFEGGGSLVQEAEKALFGGSLEEDPIETLLHDLPNQNGGADETDTLLNLCTLNTLYTLVIMYLLSDDGDDKKSFYKIALLHELENPIKLSKSEKKLFLTSFSLVPSEDVEALIKKYSPRIPEDALIGAYSILSKFVNTSAIGDPLVKYFFLFLKVVASFLDEKSKVLEELGCPNPIMTLEDYPTLPITP